jgi:hypothetical protein
VNVNQPTIAYTEYIGTWNDTGGVVRVHQDHACVEFWGAPGDALSCRELFALGERAGMNHVSTGEDTVILCRTCM